jgi:hypothetical protein
METSYDRSISAEEAREGYIMVLKDRLSFFPLPGRNFEIHSGQSTRTVRVESYHCECRGPEKPHEHYFLRWEGLKKGDRVLIQKDMRKAGRYLFSVRSRVGQREFCG